MGSTDLFTRPGAWNCDDVDLGLNAVTVEHTVFIQEFAGACFGQHQDVGVTRAAHRAHERAQNI